MFGEVLAIQSQSNGLCGGWRRSFASYVINFKCLLSEWINCYLFSHNSWRTRLTLFLLNISNIRTFHSLLYIRYIVYTHWLFPCYKNSFPVFFLFFQFLKQLGLHPNWQFVDVYGMDPELLSMVPRPVCAVLLLFPITEKVIVK